jgi:2-polyprenyl-3-methyl-5-hydroxy-6-metoxy-1,4-benzoquinol methylase
MSPEAPNPSSPWYARIFNADYLRSYSHLEETTPQQANEIATCLGLPAGAALLDLAGGYGRIAIPLAQKGYRMTVLDLSEEFLRIGRDRAQAAGVSVEWLHADMRDIPQTAGFDAVLSLFSSFGYFEKDDENERVLQAIPGALKPGGLFLLDSINPELVLRSDPFYHWVEGTDAITLDRSTFDLISGRVYTQRIFHDLRTRERKDYSFNLRLFTPAEYRNLLRRAGFTSSTFFGGLDRSPLTLQSRRVIVVAQK